MGRFALYHDPLVLEHGTGRFHPEGPGRVAACVARLSGEGFLAEAPPSPARTGRAIERVHAASYVERLREASEAVPDGFPRDQVFTFFDSPDNPTSAATWDVAVRAVGLSLAASDAVLSGEARSAFVAVRPPGHHARARSAMGFCFLNSVAVVARDLVEERGVSRVLVADFDVHHGNGTQETFWEDGRVAFLSVHRYPFYPGTGGADETGAGRGAGLTRNVPLPAGSDDASYAGGFAAALEEMADRFRPEVVLVSAGFDAHVRDPLGGMAVTGEGYHAMAAALRSVAGVHAGGRLVALLEGGYDHQGTAEGALALARVLADGSETTH